MIKTKNRIQQFIVVTFLLALTFAIGRVGALELGNITTGQAVISWVLSCLYIAIAAITYKFVGKEVRYESKR